MDCRLTVAHWLAVGPSLHSAQAAFKSCSRLQQTQPRLQQKFLVILEKIIHDLPALVSDWGQEYLVCEPGGEITIQQ